MTLRAPLLRRLLFMVGGEGMQSALHFGLNIGLLHVLSTHDYGVFAIVMVIGGLGLTYIRAFAAMPASIRIGRARHRAEADVHDVTFGTVACLLAVLIGLIVAGLLELWLKADAVAGGLFVGLWSLRSHLRMAIVARGSQALAVAVGDFTFTASGAVLIAVLLGLTVWDPLQGAFAVLAIANGLGSIAMLLAARRRVRVSLHRRTRRRYARLGRHLAWSGLSVTTANLQGQALSLLVAAIAGPDAYAPIAAAIVLFVPLRIVGTAMSNLMQPVLAAELARGRADAVWRQAWTWSGLVALGSIVYGAVMLMVLPHLRSQVFVGQPVILIGAFAWAIYATLVLYVMPRIVLEALNAFRLLTAMTTFAGLIGLAVVALLLVLVDPAWSMAGALLSELLVLACSWAVMHQLLFAKRPARGVLRWVGGGAAS